MRTDSNERRADCDETQGLKTPNLLQVTLAIIAINGGTSIQDCQASGSLAGKQHTQFQVVTPSASLRSFLPYPANPEDTKTIVRRAHDAS